MKRIILLLVVALFVLSVVPASAEKSNTGKSWSKIKDIFK